MTPLERLVAEFPPNEGRTLVVGSKVYNDKPDRRLFYADAFGVDLEDGEGVDLVHDLETPLPESVGTFDHIDCCSVLEHVQRPWKMAENILSVMRPGASILISVPFVWRIHAYPADYWRISPSGLTVLFPGVEWHAAGFAVNGELEAKVRGKNSGGGVWMARAETVAVGRLCTSTS